MKHRTLVILSGAVWLVVGVCLMSFGLHLIIKEIPAGPQATSPIDLFGFLAKDRTQASLLVITLALFIGYLKGKRVLRKAAERQIARLLEMAPPLSIRNLYSPAYLLLLALMMGFGIALRYLPIAPDLRGFIDLAVGSALIQGSTTFLRKLMVGVRS